MRDFRRKLMILNCLLFTSFCFWKAASGLVGGGDASVLPSAQAAILPSATPSRVVTTPIQEMRPGMRIVGRNPLRIQTESTVDPTPDGWRRISVRMLKADGTYFEAELLRPLSWLRRHRAQPGATIQLNMPEMYVVGAAEVLAIADCPPIDPGEGPVVLSTFKNVSDNVLNIYVEGETDPIGVTAGHPIWSEDRQAFVHSEKLQIGERLRSAVGKTVRITSIEIRAGPEPVYNLEVAGENVYSVTDSGLLVHNTGPCGLNTVRSSIELDAAGFADKRISQRGRWLGSKRLNTKQLRQYEQDLAEYGVTLKRGRAATKRLNDLGGRAGFDSFENAVYLRKNATAYDAFHEIQHVKHRAAIGQTEYRRISEYARESHVFNQIFKKRKQFNRDELKHALRYIRDERYRFRIGAID